VGGAVDDRSHQGIAIASAGPADALQVVGGLWRHRAEQHSGEIADVDAHLQGGGGREQVGVAARAVVDELVLKPLAVFAGEQTGVLAGDDPVHQAGGQGIHRINEDHLHAPLAGLLGQAAVLKAGVEKGLGLARAGARSHLGVLG
jgi:hypothetical protein